VRIINLDLSTITILADRGCIASHHSVHIVNNKAAVFTVGPSVYSCHHSFVSIQHLAPMLPPIIYSLVLPYLLVSWAEAACTPSTSSTGDLQNALQQGGQGYTLQLCAGETYSLQQALNYTAPDQVSRISQSIIRS
jgi:hypothetical protein